MQLVLTGLPRLQHLTLNQQAPRVDPRQHECCTAFRLPNSLCSFDLTQSTCHLCIHSLGVLQYLPALTDVGLHGPALDDFPNVGTTVTRYEAPALYATYVTIYIHACVGLP